MRHRRLPEPRARLKFMSEDFVDQLSELNTGIARALKRGETFTISITYGRAGKFISTFSPSTAQILKGTLSKKNAQRIVGDR